MIDYELKPEDFEQMEQEVHQNNSNEPKSSRNPETVKVESPDAAEIPVLYTPRIMDVGAVDNVTALNWDTLERGFDMLEDRLVEQFRQRGKVAAAKARAAYSKEIADGLKSGKQED